MPRIATPHQIAPDLDAQHDAGFAAASERAARALDATAPEQLGRPIVRGATDGHEVAVGTASWTDPTITKGGVFYPRGVSSSEDRLRYYASQFPVVEVDSTYYSLPERAIAALWAERTPDDFVFHVKAHALMTGQPTEVARLPEPLIDALPAALAEKPRIYAKDLPLELYDAVWAHFLDALEPLRGAGKLGGVLLQYPRWFLPTPENKDHLAESAVRLAGTPGAVELRNRHWYGGSDGSGTATQWTMDMLRDLGLTYVMVDGPQGLESSVPPSRGDDARAGDGAAARASRRDVGGGEGADRGALSLPVRAGGAGGVGAEDRGGVGAGATHHGLPQQLLRQLRHDQRARADGAAGVARARQRQTPQLSAASASSDRVNQSAG